LWFAGNAVLPQLQNMYGWQADALGYLTSSVQLGFIIGTLSFALTGITDRFSPSRIFFASSVAGALFNVICLIDVSSFNTVLISRFLTGFSLAGIYPVGMKIAADWNEKGLGHWLGALVGALVLGTSFPHALKLFPGFVNPEIILITVSILAIVGGVIMMAFVHDGPFRKPASRFSFKAVREIFSVPKFQSPAFGYFGHMWELYTFWAFVPWILSTYQLLSGEVFSISLWSFIIIGSGFLGCIFGGQLSLRFGSKRIATIALISSGICCILSPLMFQFSLQPFLAFLFFWGFMVVADSPQFSALVAFYAPPQLRGSAITLTTCIGFSITIISIQLLNYLQSHLSPEYLLILLSPGPILGIVFLSRKLPE
jgi:MFS family permease